MIAAVLLACVHGGAVGDRLSEVDRDTLATMWPLPAPPDDPTNAVADDPRAVAIGHALFFDRRLSADGQASCASCHDPELGWADGRVLGRALDAPPRHTPGLTNVAWNRWTRWDGACDSLWCQALGPLEATAEMGSARTSVVRLLATDDALREAVTELFREPPPPPDDTRFPAATKPGDEAWEQMTVEDRTTVDRWFSRVGKLLSAYQRQLASRDSAFDRWAEATLTGSDATGTMSDDAIAGFELFVGEARCVLCHSGPNLSNGEFHNVGLGPRPWLDVEDRGRADGIVALRTNPFNGAGVWSDDPEQGEARIRYLSLGGEQAGQFKVPTLRNVALTAPYMHGGHFDTLDAVLDFYVGDAAEAPALGHRDEVITARLDAGQRAQLRAFLETLTAPVPEAWAVAPDGPRWAP